MASKTAAGTLQSLSWRSRLCCTCINSIPRSSKQWASVALRQFSSTSETRAEQETEQRPRWSSTPPQMKSPVSIRRKPLPKKVYVSNSDPKKLDAMYNNFLGEGGAQLLPEEIKWLAVTHKSFDQGRRGFNDRLAYFGKRILELQATLQVFHSPMATETQSRTADLYGREPFQHEGLAGLRNLHDVNVSSVLSKERLGQLAESYGIGKVTRWVPKNASNLQGSGSDVVYTVSLLAILGAISLQKGGEVASTIAREKILKKLGL